MALILRNGGSQSPDRWLKEPRNNQIDEGIVQTDIYSENEVQKYKKEKFKNMIYEVVGGQFKDEIKSIADGYLDVMDVKHYVIVTMNYNIDIISEGEPEIEIKS